ncbi:hypothetical protein EAF04_005768 [Stromatinia cepivora]|nr:hypothetical protein EAF04_005768 [Stromatinia cepivora]
MSLVKTNVYKYGSDATGLNHNQGTTRNLYNNSHYTGCFSFGAAYAVVAGLIPFIYGAEGEVVHTGSTVKATGPLAATMLGLEAIYRVPAQPDPSDVPGQFFTPPSIYRPLFAPADDSAIAIYQKHLLPLSNFLASAPQTKQLLELVRKQLLKTTFSLKKYYPGIPIVTPTCSIPYQDKRSNQKRISNTVLPTAISLFIIANSYGNPAISVPVAYVDPVKTASGEKIPIGLMAMGEWVSEDQLLGWGREVEIYLNEAYEGGNEIER